MPSANDPFPYFSEAGTGGYIYIGAANQDAQTNPVTVYRDESRTIAWAQPIRTVNGYPAYQGAKANIFVGTSPWSMTVKNPNGEVVTNATNVDSFLLVTDSVNLGTLPSGSTNAIDIARTATSGAADGSSQFYSLVSRVYAQGSNDYSNVRGQYLGSHVNTTGGSVALADGLHAYVWQAGAGNIANVQVIAAHVRLDGPGDVTTEAICFRCVSTTLGAGVTVPTLKGLSIGDIGDATKITNVYGIDIEDIVASSVAIGVRSVMNAATNKYFLFGAGTAQSAHNGHFGIGITNAPLWKLTVRESASTFIADFGNTHASAPFGIRVQYTVAAPNGSDNAFITCQDSGATRFEVTSDGRVKIGANFVLNGRQSAVTAPTGGATVDSQARTAINDLIARLQAHGLIS